MDNHFPLLTIILFLPIAGQLLVLLMKSKYPKAAYSVSVIVSGVALLLTIGFGISGKVANFAHIEEVKWIPSLGAAYRLGVDGISYPMVLLTAILFFAVFIFSSKIKKNAAGYFALMLLLQTACFGVFLSLDLLLFYVFFEVTLVGMYFLIAGWGHENRKKAAITFFIYTLIGSLVLLLALLSLYLNTTPRTFDMRTLIAHHSLTGTVATLTFWGLFISFAIKTPLFPFHTWLPLAHTEAPATGSAILAGILLKLGAYGFIRFSLQMMPDTFREYAGYIVIVAVVSAVYGAFVAMAQTDIKRMVAYTSVNHMGYLVFGVAAAAATSSAAGTLALDGAVLQMFSHGIVTGCLFLLVGTLQQRLTTREMPAIQGLLKTFPVLSALFVIAAFASLGLPRLAHFPAEFQIFLGGYSVYPVAVGFMLIGLLITAGLYLRSIQMSFMGIPNVGVLKSDEDLHRYELWAIIPLIILMIIIGLFPNILLSLIHQTTKMLVR
jgi:NADH-quinone oxidoreductase subunit M